MTRARAPGAVHGKRFLEAIGDEGFRPSRALGQNFILDSSLLDFIVRSSEVSAHDTVLEIGTGAGQLTGRLALVAEKVVSYEIDKRLATAASRSLDGFANVSVRNADALAGKNSLNPELVSDVSNAEAAPPGKLLLVSNLAYSIATPVLLLLFESGLPFDSMTVTVQWEAAERFCADDPAKQGYGPVSLQVAWFARANVVRAIPRDVFWPRPRVRSALVRFETLHPARERVDYDRFKALVRAAFGYRRKSAVASMAASGIMTREEARALFERAGIETRLRAEQLTMAQFENLSELRRSSL